MIGRCWAREQLVPDRLQKWCEVAVGDGRPDLGPRISEKRANMSRWKLKMGAYGGVCGRGCHATALASVEGDEALQVLDDSTQGELTLQSSQTSPPRSRESMLILALSEEVLASDAKFAADLIALCLLDVPDPVTGFGLLQLPIPRPPLLQVERAPLPDRQRLLRFVRKKRDVGFDVTLEEFRDEVTRSVACVARQDLRPVAKTYLVAGLQNLVEHLQCRVPLGGSRRQTCFTPQDDAALRVDQVMGQIAGSSFTVNALAVQASIRICGREVRLVLVAFPATLPIPGGLRR